jgi:hypothetical protein
MKLIFKLLPLFSFLFLLSCTNDNLSEETIKKSIEEMSSLGTIEYNLSKILIVDDQQWFTVGDRKALINLKANLVAGVDFKKIKIDNIQGKEISLSIPTAEIIYLDIPPDKINFAVLHTSFFRNNFSNEELNQIQILGENDIKQKIKDLGILDEAYKNSVEIISNWLKLVGFEKIIIL